MTAPDISATSRGDSLMDIDEVSAWFDRYNDAFAACARGERPLDDVLAYYADPLLMTTDDAVVAHSLGAMADWAEAQMRELRSTGYDATEITRREVVPLNRSTALFTGEFSRLTRAGYELAAFTVTYLITGTGGRRAIAALALHSL